MQPYLDEAEDEERRRGADHRTDRPCRIGSSPRYRPCDWQALRPPLALHIAMQRQHALATAAMLLTRPAGGFVAAAVRRREGGVRPAPAAPTVAKKMFMSSAAMPSADGMSGCRGRGISVARATAHRQDGFNWQYLHR